MYMQLFAHSNQDRFSMCVTCAMRQADPTDLAGRWSELSLPV